MIKVGDKVKFDHLKDIRISGLAYGKSMVKGVVIEVHEDHRWFGVRYSLGDDASLRTSFNFADIGVNVFPCK